MGDLTPCGLGLEGRIFFFNSFIYLFIFGCAGSVAAFLFSSCSEQGQGARGGGGSAGIFSLQCPLLLGSSCRLQQQRYVGSVVTAPGL